MSSFSRSKRLSFTTTFRRPIASMISSAWRSAPAPIESIAITAPTPKMIPSIARNERSAWWRRLSMPELSDFAQVDHEPGPDGAPARADACVSLALGSRSAITSPGGEAAPDDDAARCSGAPCVTSTASKPLPLRR